MKRFMVTLLLGCGASTPMTPHAERPTQAEPTEVVSAPVPLALPAGFYFRERAESSTCFDCATPAAAVVMDFDGELPSIARPLALGYPRVGKITDRIVVILGLFESEPDARTWLGDDESMRVELIPPSELIPNTTTQRAEPNPDRTRWVQSDPTTSVHAYSEQDVRRWVEHGDIGDTPLCSLEPNTVWQVQTDALGNAQMNYLSVPFTCPGGQAAFVRKRDTLLNSTYRRTDHGFEKTQRLYAECGDIGYLSVRYDRERREVAREEFAMGPGCVAPNAIAARARRSCPEGTVLSCVSAGRAHLESDPRRGLQLLERSCDLGNPLGCRAVAAFVAELGGRDAMRQALYRVRHHCETGDAESCQLITSVLQAAAARSDRAALTEACELREHDDSMARVSTTACALLATL